MRFFIIHALVASTLILEAKSDDEHISPLLSSSLPLFPLTTVSTTTYPLLSSFSLFLDYYSYNYFVRRPSVSALRPDSLAQLLSYGNVYSGGTVLVLDSYAGLIVGAVLERLGGR